MTFRHDTFIDPYLCSIDPITAGIGALVSAFGGASSLGAAALGAGAAVAASSLSGSGSSPGASRAQTPSEVTTAPAAPPPAAAPAMDPIGNRNQNRSNTPSFVGASAVPQQAGFGQKTLLGQ